MQRPSYIDFVFLLSAVSDAIETVTGQLDKLAEETNSEAFESLYDNFLQPLISMAIESDEVTGFCFGDYKGADVAEELEDYGCDSIPLDEEFGL